MTRINHLLSVGVLGTSLVSVLIAFTPTDASAMFETKLGCSENICCTYDDQTGQIYSCVFVRTT